jgi:hypothetical protein
LGATFFGGGAGGGVGRGLRGAYATILIVGAKLLSVPAKSLPCALIVGADDRPPAAHQGTSMPLCVHTAGAVDDGTFGTETSVSVDILSKEAGGPDGADQLYIVRLSFL